MGRHGRPEVSGPESATLWMDMQVPMQPGTDQAVYNQVMEYLGTRIKDGEPWPRISVRNPGGPRSLPVIRIAGTAEEVLNASLPMIAVWAVTQQEMRTG